MPKMSIQPVRAKKQPIGKPVKKAGKKKFNAGAFASAKKKVFGLK